jgi:hypothetical protein
VVRRCAGRFDVISSGCMFISVINSHRSHLSSLLRSEVTYVRRTRPRDFLGMKTSNAENVQFTQLLYRGPVLTRIFPCRLQVKLDQLFQLGIRIPGADYLIKRLVPGVSCLLDLVSDLVTFLITEGQWRSKCKVSWCVFVG